MSGRNQVAGTVFVALVVASIAGASIVRAWGAPTMGAIADVEPLRLDVNSASADELELLPSVGPALAAKIVADRAARGPFKCVADLDRVSGIGPATLEEIAPYVRCGSR